MILFYNFIIVFRNIQIILSSNHHCTSPAASILTVIGPQDRYWSDQFYGIKSPEGLAEERRYFHQNPKYLTGNIERKDWIISPSTNYKQKLLIQSHLTEEQLQFLIFVIMDILYHY